MPKFESGVKAYVHAVGLVENFFPIDGRDNEFICCQQCFFYREASQTCGLNHMPILYPNKYVGQECMLHRVTDEQFERLQNALIEIIMENENDGTT